jgi:hypothetical protein
LTKKSGASFRLELKDSTFRDPGALSRPKGEPMDRGIPTEEVLAEMRASTRNAPCAGASSNGYLLCSR